MIIFVGGQARKTHSSRFEPARVDHAIDGRASLGKDDAPVEPPGAHRERREAHSVGAQVRFDALRVTRGSEGEFAVEAAAGDCQSAGEAARVGPQIAARRRAADVERGDRDGRAAALGQENPSVSCKRPKARTAVRSVIETRWVGHQQQAHVAQSERFVGTVEEQVDARPLDAPFDSHRSVPYLACGRALRWEGAVAVARPAPLSRSLARIIAGWSSEGCRLAASRFVSIRGSPRQCHEEAVVERRTHAFPCQ